MLKANSNVITSQMKLAEQFLPRFLGLMGRKSMPAGEAICFPRCNSIHTMFMRFPIDVIFLNGEDVVIEIVERVPAWRLLLPRWSAKTVIEMGPGEAKRLGLVKGMKLSGWEKIG